VQDALGHGALPLACRQFPRLAVRDPRGISLSLSLYCPTACAQLDDDRAVSIVESPPAFPPDGDYEGLDAATALPPLLRPDMLMDWASWWRFEAASVALITAPGAAVAGKLGRLRRVVGLLEDWSPPRGPLALAVDRAFAEASPGATRFEPDDREVGRRLSEIEAAIPADLRPDPWPPDGIGRTPEIDDGRAARFLAAHAFANWIAHLGDGLDAWLRSIEAAYVCLLAGMDVRQADLRLRHLASPNALAKTWSRSA
jgi:hypothetical protein